MSTRPLATDGDHSRTFRPDAWGDEITDAELRHATEVLSAYLAAVQRMMRDFLEAYAPILEAYARELGAVTRSLTDFATAVEKTRAASDRPAWMSPHGPARAKRSRGRHR